MKVTVNYQRAFKDRDTLEDRWSNPECKISPSPPRWCWSLYTNVAVLFLHLSGQFTWETPGAGRCAQGKDLAMGLHVTMTLALAITLRSESSGKPTNCLVWNVETSLWGHEESWEGLPKGDLKIPPFLPQRNMGTAPIPSVWQQLSSECLRRARPWAHTHQQNQLWLQISGSAKTCVGMWKGTVTVSNTVEERVQYYGGRPAWPTELRPEWKGGLWESVPHAAREHSPSTELLEGAPRRDMRLKPRAGTLHVGILTLSQ